MKKRKYFFVVIIACLIYACNTTVEYDKPVSGEELVAESYIIEGDSCLMVRLEKAGSIYSSEYGPMYFDKNREVHGADVKITLDGVEHQLKEIPDDLWFYQFYSYSVYKKYMKIQRYSSCVLNVKYNDQKITSTANFPEKVKLLSATAKPIYNKNIFKLNLEMMLGPTGKTCYNRVKFLIEIVSNNKKGYVNFDPIYLILSGENKDPRSFLLSTYNCSIPTGFSFEDFKYSRILIYLEGISEEYHNFRQALKIQKEDADSPWGGEVTEIPTNITNGFGIFTCITRDTICANIIQ